MSTAASAGAKRPPEPSDPKSGERVVLVGAGRLGSALGEGLQAAGVSVVQVVSRSEASARKLGETLGCDWTTDLTALLPNASIVLLAVPDRMIAALAEEIKPVLPAGAVCAHCSGATPLAALAPLGEAAGVFYPLQTFSPGRNIDFAEVPVFVEGAAPDTTARLLRLARLLSESVFEADSSARLRLHTGAVFASNFTNHLLHIAGELAAVSGADHRVYLPLLRETAAKLAELSPAAAQTGPALRGDQPTLDAHLALLQTIRPEWAALYRLLSEGIGGERS